jgi:signal transduction histidine kinase
MTSKTPSSNNKDFQFKKMFIIGLAVTVGAGALLYYLTSRYVLSQAEKNIQNLLLSHRGIHLYIQRVMHPALYRFKADGEIPEAFYAPELFSSSYMVRNQHQFYNEARAEADLPEVYYKMAAANPRNPVNKADILEEELIDMFNKNPEKLTYRNIVEINGQKYLYYAMPFLKTEEHCLKCHGVREIAPIQLQKLYPGEGGFHDQVGNIRAIESIRAPLKGELFTVYIISGSLLSGFLVIFCLFLFNRSLKTTVLNRTLELEQEVLERKRVESEIRELNLELEKRVDDRTLQLAAANKELDAFAYSVSHDLRAPLRGIDGFSMALLEDYQDRFDETGKEYLNRIRKACVRMGNLIDDLLQMSRLSRGEIHRESVDLSGMAHAVLQELRQAAPDRKVQADITPGIVVIGDTALLRAVMDNLLGNAWKFTGKTEESLISFGVTEKDGKPVYFVRDNGAGFNMAYSDKLFGAFQRLHSPGEFEGTGIGLATVQRIIHRHGGRIWAQGEEGRGAIFHFTLS